MSSVRPVTNPAMRVADARPGAVLASAAGVPIGAAVVLAAGLLPWGARLVLGVALAVLGLRIRALVGTALGARIRSSTARALGLATLGGGALVVCGAVASALDGARVAVGGVEGAGSGGAVGGATLLGVAGSALAAWPAVAFGALLAVAGAALVREDRGGATGAVLLGTGAAVVLLGVTGAGALGLGPDARLGVLLALAAAGAVATAPGRPTDGLRARAPGDVSRSGTASGSPRATGVVRATGVAAGVLVAVAAGEASGLVGVVAGAGLGPGLEAPTTAGGVAILRIAAAAVAVVLLSGAWWRRDPVVGLLPLAVLLQAHPVGSDAERVGVLVVPLALALAAVASRRGVRAARRLVGGAEPPVLAGFVLLALLVGVAGALGGPEPVGPDGTWSPAARPLVAAIACTAGLLALAALAVAGRGPTLAVLALLGLHALHPLSMFRDAAPTSWPTEDLAVVVSAALELALGALLVLRRPSPAALGAAGVLVAGTLGHVGVVIAGGGKADGTLLVVATVGTAASAVVLAGGLALLGPARRVAGAQAAGAGLAFGTALSGAASAAFLTLGADGPGAVLEGSDAVLAVALLGVAGLGTTLLAASTARRPSPPVAAVAVLGAAALGTATAAVGAAIAGLGTDDLGTVGAPIRDAALGFADLGSPLRHAVPGWPLLLGVLGLVLLGAGTWLESRRPAPPDAPVG